MPPRARSRASPSRRAPLARAVAGAVLALETPLRALARSGVEDGDPRLALAARELGRLGRLAHADHRALLAPHALEDAVGAADAPADAALPPAAAALLERLAGADGWEAAAPALRAFFAAEGQGVLAVRRVARWQRGRGLVAVARPDATTLADLVGGEDVRRPLLADLARLADGARPNDALLYGPPGTGKSATVRACAHALGGRGVRLVEVVRDDLDELPAILEVLAGGPPTVLFLDDLVFDEHGRGDRELRAVLEGSTTARPANVLVWATSNRLRLLGDSMAQRADDADPEEGAAERAALAQRFGRRIRVARQDRAGYLAIVRALVGHRAGADIAALDEAAMRFAVQGHGLSARTAHQFALAYGGEG